jgi:hypothetical protein
MGTFRIEFELENPNTRGRAPHCAKCTRRHRRRALVDSRRHPRVAGKRTADDVVFGEPGDLILLGARALEGLNFRIEPARSVTARKDSDHTPNRIPKHILRSETCGSRRSKVGNEMPVTEAPFSGNGN